MSDAPTIRALQSIQRMAEECNDIQVCAEIQVAAETALAGAGKPEALDNSHEHEFIPPANDDEQQCDTACRWQSHLCRVCGKSRKELAVEAPDAPTMNRITEGIREDAKRIGLKLLQFDSDSQPCSMGDSLDDIGGVCVGFHLERMSENNYWLGIDLAGGSHLRFSIGHKSQRARINAYVEIEVEE